MRHDDQVTERRTHGGLSHDEFIELYESCHAALSRYFVRRLGSSAAEDLTATTFAEAWASRARYERWQSTPRTWIWAIATKLCAKYLRSEGRRRAFARIPRTEGSAGSMDDIDRRLDAEQEWVEVSMRVEQLDPKDRHLLLLYAWGDLSYDELADVLGVPLGTVKSRLNRARARIGARERSRAP